MQARKASTKVFMVRGGTFDAEVLINGETVWIGRGYSTREEAQIAADREIKQIAPPPASKSPT